MMFNRAIGLAHHLWVGRRTSLSRLLRASQLINRLQKCAFGEISLTVTQLRAIEILLRKCIPDLAAAEIRSEQTHRYVVELPPVLGRDEWQRKYGQN